MKTAPIRILDAENNEIEISVQCDDEFGPKVAIIVSEPKTLTVPSTPATAYDLWVDGVQVTPANKGNILDDSGTPTATYDPDTETLTLNGYDGGVSELIYRVKR